MTDDSFAIPSHDPFADNDKPQASVWPIMLRTLVLMMLADEVIDPREQKAVQEVYEQSGLKLDARRLILEVKDIRKSDALDPISYLSDKAPQLSPTDKTLLLRSAWRVACADGEIHEDEKDLIRDMANCLSVSKSDLEEILSTIHAPIATTDDHNENGDTPA